MKNLKFLLVALLASSLSLFALTGCNDSEVGDELEEAADNTKDAMENAGDKMEDAAEKTADAVKDATN